MLSYWGATSVRIAACRQTLPPPFGKSISFDSLSCETSVIHHHRQFVKHYRQHGWWRTVAGVHMHRDTV